MPLLTDEQLHAIRQIIADHHAAFVANYISPDALPPEILTRLQEQGLISTTGNIIEDAYLYGMVIAAAQDPAVATMNLDQFRDYMRRNPMPLSAVERRAMEYAQHQAGQYAVGLGNTFDVIAGQAVITAASAMEQEKMRGQIRDLTQEAVAKRKAMRGLASDLKWATRDFTRNWDRIATTELHNAHQNGMADDLVGRYGPEVRVAKRPTPDACEHCKRLHLVGGSGPPRVFKLSELQANGTNFKKKARDWQAVVGSVHPNCQCQMVRVPAGWGFDENWDIVPGGDREDYETAGEIQRAIQLEDELRKAFKLQGHIDFQGIPIAIENRKGTTRTWTTPEGDTGQTRMEYAYGYAKRTSGDDEDDIDVYVGPDPRSQRVFVVNQIDAVTGRHDETKCFVGFRSEGDAKLAYLSHINNPGMFGGILAMDIDQFKRWLGTTEKAPGHGMGETRLTVPLQKAKLTPEAMAKAEARGGKYIRREPYTDKRGKRRFRYYYKESAAAREAKVGTELRLGARTVKVIDAKPSGQIILSIDGKRKLVSPEQWHEMLHAEYGESYAKSAERRAQQAINAVLRLVPREQLQDLKGKTDAERLAELERKVPAVYAKLQKAYQRAGMSPLQAKRSLSIILERRGWKPEARALVIGTVIKHRTIGTRELVVASESLARGKPVSAGHVATVVELRTPGGNPVAFTKIVATVAETAEAELANLSKALAKAKRQRDDARTSADALATALGSDAVQKLNLIGQAFPGLQDKALDDVKRALEAVNEVQPSRPPTTEGGDTVVFVSGEGGRPEPLAAKYRLVEADTLIASHDPDTFSRHKKYPADVQERAYHRDKAEQAKVIRNAQNMDPRFVVNTNPDSVNGPPMVMDDGIVLGGNSRAMSMQRIYTQHPEKAAQMRQYLKDHAHEVGLNAGDVEQMKNPVLIREVQVEDRSKKKLQLLVRQMNESFTQAMDPRTMQVAMGRRLSDSTLEALGNEMAEDDTLTSFLASNRSGPFVSALFRAGVIDNRNVSQYMKRGTRTLNEDGRTLVARILVGRTVDDADVLSNTGAQMLDSVARSVPFMAMAKASGGGDYDLGPDLAVAIDAFNDLRGKVEAGTLRNLDPKMSDREVQKLLDNQFGSLFGDVHPVVKNERASTLLGLLIRKRGPIQLSKVFREYARIAKQNPAEQTTMFGERTSGLEALRQAIKGGGEAQQELLAASMPLTIDLQKGGGYYVGPRGGKWADPQHTIPWSDKAKEHGWKPKMGPGFKVEGYSIPGTKVTAKKEGKAFVVDVGIEGVEPVKIPAKKATLDTLNRVLDHMLAGKTIKKSATPVGGVTPGGYRVTLARGKRRYTKETPTKAKAKRVESKKGPKPYRQVNPNTGEVREYPWKKVKGGYNLPGTDITFRKRGKNYVLDIGIRGAAVDLGPNAPASIANSAVNVALHRLVYDKNRKLRKYKTLAQAEKALRLQPNEHAVAFSGGKYVFHATSNDPNSVAMPAPLVAAMAGEDAVFTHNHPGGGMLSLEDINSALQLDQAEIRALTPTGGYSLKRPEGGWGDRSRIAYVMDGFVGMLNIARDASRRRMDEYIKEHGSYSQEAWDDISNSIIFEFYNSHLRKQYGIEITRFSADPGGDAPGRGDARPQSRPDHVPATGPAGEQLGLFKGGQRLVIDLEKAGPFVGPRGGLWADPQHKIPWKEKKGRQRGLPIGPKREPVGHATDTPEFKRWFGSSKVTDDAGNPLRVYHITRFGEYTEYSDKVAKEQEAAGLDLDWKERGQVTRRREPFDVFKPGGDKPTMSGPAIWFSPQKEHQPARHNVPSGGETEGAAVYPVYLSIKRPLYIDAEDTEHSKWAAEVYGGAMPYYMSPKNVADIRADGYDGIIVREKGKPEEFVVFESTQIKSAIGNRGTFDPDDPSILKSELEKAGPFVGPRGGLWADPKHTIHWDPAKHGPTQMALFKRPAPKRQPVPKRKPAKRQKPPAPGQPPKSLVQVEPMLTPEQKARPKSAALKVIEAKDFGDPREWKLPPGARVDDPWEPDPPDPNQKWKHPDYGAGAGAAPWDQKNWAPKLDNYDYIIVNSSAGKDSQAMLSHVVEQADKVGFPREKIIVVHADLGRIEWEKTKSLAQEQAEHYGLRYEVVRFERPDAPEMDLLGYIEERYGNLIQRAKDTAMLAEAGIRTWADLANASVEEVVAIIGEGVGTGRWDGKHRAKEMIRKAPQKAASAQKDHDKDLATVVRRIEREKGKAKNAKSEKARKNARERLTIAQADLKKLRARGEAINWPVDFGLPIAWPAAGARFCTSDFKTRQVDTLITEFARQLREEHKGRTGEDAPRILNALGIRAQESDERAKKPAFGRQKQTRNQIVDRWYPIHQWHEREVWDIIERSGIPHHKAYDLGMRRLSCVFCPYATKQDLMVAAMHNPHLFREYLEMEEKVGAKFKAEHGLSDVRDEMQRRQAEGYELSELAEWVKKALDLELSTDLVKAALKIDPTPTYLLMEAAYARLRRNRQELSTVTLEWKPNGLCVHLDGGAESHHVEFVPYPQAYNASMVAAYFAQAKGMAFEEHNAPGPMAPDVGEPELEKALPRRTTSPLPVGGQVSTEVGAQTSPAAYRAPGHGTFPNFLPGSPERTPVKRNPDVIGWSPNEQDPEDIERRRVRGDMDDKVTYNEPVPVEPRTVEKPEPQLYIGIEGPMVNPGRDGVPVVTTEASQQWHPRDDAGVNERDRIETDLDYYDQATSADDVDDHRIREERPISPELGLVIHERTGEDRQREQDERDRLVENERKGRMRPKNKVR